MKSKATSKCCCFVQIIPQFSEKYNSFLKLLFVTSGTTELKTHFEYPNNNVSPELACFLTYHEIPEAAKLPPELKQENGIFYSYYFHLSIPSPLFLFYPIPPPLLCFPPTFPSPSFKFSLHLLLPLTLSSPPSFFSISPLLPLLSSPLVNSAGFSCTPFYSVLVRSAQIYFALLSSSSTLNR